MYFEMWIVITNITIGASNNRTGNLQYGGDWLLESTNENIKNIYFTDNIDNYEDVLILSTQNNALSTNV